MLSEEYLGVLFTCGEFALDVGRRGGCASQ